MPYEVDLKPNLFASRYFSIDENNLVYHDTEMAVADIVGFAYGATVTKVNGIKTNTDYAFKVIDSAGDEIKINFYTTVNIGYNVEAVNGDIIKYFWEFFGNRILTETIQKISSGQQVVINGCTLSNEGIQMRYKPLFGSAIDYIVDWDDITYEIFQGLLTVKSESEKKAKNTMGLGSDYNSHILMTIIDILKKDPSFIDTLRGKK